MAAEDDDLGAPSTSSPASIYGGLQTLLLSFDSLDDFLNNLAHLAQSITIPPLSCGITFEYNRRPLTVSSSDGLARSLDEVQYDAGDGPCLHAMHTGQPVWIPDLAIEDRWPSYVAHAQSRGLRESLSLPLIVEGVSIGAINLYSRESGPLFVGKTRTRVDLFTAQASTALLLAIRQLRQTAENTSLEAALTSRSVIDQAIGVLMGQQRCSAEDAFDLLRRHSQNNNRPLREVAAELLARVAEVRGPE